MCGMSVYIVCEYVHYVSRCACSMHVWRVAVCCMCGVSGLAVRVGRHEHGALMGGAYVYVWYTCAYGVNMCMHYMCGV